MRPDVGRQGLAEYGRLYRQHQARIMRLACMLLQDRHEAEDVTQEVFLTMHREHQREPSSMLWGPWLTRVTVNACHRRRRSRWWRWWRDASEEYDVDSIVATDGTPEAATVTREQRERMVRIFRRLSSRQQEVFVLRRVEGYATREVAELLGIDGGSVKRHLFRAVRAFQKGLTPR